MSELVTGKCEHCSQTFG